jgi:hypothetical protein
MTLVRRRLLQLAAAATALSASTDIVLAQAAAQARHVRRRLRSRHLHPGWARPLVKNRPRDPAFDLISLAAVLAFPQGQILTAFANRALPHS